MIAIAACANHPGREALGVCVRCRTRVCAECVTKVDGINYCVTCLAIMAVDVASNATVRVGGVRFGRVRLVASVLVLVLLTWALLDVMLPGTA